VTSSIGNFEKTPPVRTECLQSRHAFNYVIDSRSCRSYNPAPIRAHYQEPSQQSFDIAGIPTFELYDSTVLNATVNSPPTRSFQNLSSFSTAKHGYCHVEQMRPRRRFGLVGGAARSGSFERAFVLNIDRFVKVDWAAVPAQLVAIAGGGRRFPGP
jgi:hypothetical protein